MDGLSGLVNVTFPSLLRIAYKRKERRMERELEEFLFRILCKIIILEIPKKINIGHYSGGGAEPL